MSTAFDYGDDASDNPFDASYEEYVRTVEADERARLRLAQSDEDESADVPDDPEVTLASTETADFSSPAVGEGVEAPWSNLGETTEGDPFAAPEEDDSPMGE